MFLASENQPNYIQPFQAILDASPDEHRKMLENTFQATVMHKEIIDKFECFPHRNAVFGRESTDEEREYLKDAMTFGQG